MREKRKQKYAKIIDPQIKYPRKQENQPGRTIDRPGQWQRRNYSGNNPKTQQWRGKGEQNREPNKSKEPIVEFPNSTSDEDCKNSGKNKNAKYSNAKTKI